MSDEGAKLLADAIENSPLRLSGLVITTDKLLTTASHRHRHTPEGTVATTEPDELFFHRFPQRQYRIRLPFGKESESDFQTLGPHDTERRRIIAWKVPRNIRAPYVMWAGKIVRTPFLAFADEEIADNDDILGPILNDIMTNAAAEHGMFT